MTTFADLTEEEANLWAILQDPSGIDLAEWAWYDPDAEGECFRAWPYQWAWWHCLDPLQIDQSARSVGKSLSIKVRAFSHVFRHPGQEMVVTAPELVHLEPITRLVENQILNVRLSREMLPRTRSAITHRPFQIDFLNGAKIIGRIPQRDGKGVKGVHPLVLELDEGQDFPEPGWVELIETLKRGFAGAIWHVHGVTRGVRDYFYKFTQPDSGWTVHHLVAMHRPNWTDQERQEKMDMYGSRDAPDYRRNILGMHGDATNPLFVLHRLMECVDTDEADDYNQIEYYKVKLTDEYVREEETPITGLVQVPQHHLDLRNRDGNRYWIGMDVGYMNHPSEILVYLETPRKGQKSQLKLMARVHLRRISHGDQVNTILHLIRQYKPTAFAMDKMQPVSEPVLTPEGWRPIGDLCVGDQVIGSSGEAIKVRGVYPQADRRVMRVRFVDGVETRCGPEHLWTIDLKRRRSRERMTVTTDQMMSLAERYGYSKVSVPLLSGPVQYELREELPIDPYVLGCLIGDGNLGERSIRFSSTDQEIIEELRARLPADCSLEHTDRCNYIIKGSGWRHTRNQKGQFSHSNSLLDRLRELGLAGKLSYEKFLPIAYTQSSVEDRIQLLRGLMDTDGHCTVQNGSSTIGFRSSSKRLVDQIADLVRSLGGMALYTSARSFLNGEEHRTSHRVTLQLPGAVNPFFLSRKRDAVIDRRRPLCRYLRSVVPDVDEESVCIRVDADDELYVTKDYILTHNTGIGLPLFQDIQERAPELAEFIKGYGFSEKILVDFDKTIDVDQYREDPVKKAGIYRNVLEYSSDRLRDLVDHKRLLLPYDKEIVKEFQGQTWTMDKSGMDQYGRSRRFSSGSFHALDAAKMMALGWAQYGIEEMMKPKQEDVTDIFVSF